MNFLTADLPGTGGIYKETPEDFQVEEIPLYPCCGAGEHLFLWIEKAGISTRELLHRLSRGLRIRERDIGYAGLKDARALTRQMISVPLFCHEHLEKLNEGSFKILQKVKHTNKLRLGHLAGNRFTITLRETGPAAAPKAEKILSTLERLGVPNLFGEQRYGVLGNSALLGRLLLQKRYNDFCREYIGDPEQIRHPQWQQAAHEFRAGNLPQAIALLPGRMRDERRLLHRLSAGEPAQTAVLSLPRNLLRLFLSAFQSGLFDRLVADRLTGLGHLLDGDIAYKHNNGACFIVEQAALEQPRADCFEISPTAPLFGSKTMPAKGRPGEIETTLLQTFGLSSESWNLGKGLTMPGERRPLRVPLESAKILDSGADWLTLNFSLPKGSYATSVLREVCK